MAIDKGNTPPNTEQPYLRADQNYNAWAAAFQVQTIINDTGHRFVPVPQVWMVLLNPEAILDRARVAEIYDPEPVCAFSQVPDRHCPKPLNHAGSHDPSSYTPHQF